MSNVPPAPVTAAMTPAVDHRPPPRLPQVIAAAGGVLVVLGFLILLTKLHGGGLRIAGILLSLLLEAIAIGMLLLWRRRPATAGGVTVSLLAVLPAMTFIVTDTSKRQGGIHSVSDLKTKVTLVLLVAALAWIILYFVGPVKRMTIYLGAAALAVVDILVLQIGVVERTVPTYSSDNFSDLGPRLVRSFVPVDFAPGRAGTTALIAGLVLLGGGYLFDRAAQSRPGTAGYAVGVVSVVSGLFTLAFTDLKVEGASAFGMVIGVAVAWLGVRTGRRFTAWTGAAGFGFASVTLAISWFSKSQLAAGLVLLLFGIAVVVAAHYFTGGVDPFPFDDGRLPGRAGIPPAPRPRPAAPVVPASSPPVAPAGAPPGPGGAYPYPYGSPSPGPPPPPADRDTPTGEIPTVGPVTRPEDRPGGPPA